MSSMAEASVHHWGMVVSHHVDLPVGLLECPHNMAAGISQKVIH